MSILLRFSFLRPSLFAVAACLSPPTWADDPLAVIAPLGPGPYTVACNNLSQDFSRVGAGVSCSD